MKIQGCTIFTQFHFESIDNDFAHEVETMNDPKKYSSLFQNRSKNKKRHKSPSTSMPCEKQDDIARLTCLRPNQIGPSS